MSVSGLPCSVSPALGDILSSGRLRESLDRKECESEFVFLLVGAIRFSVIDTRRACIPGF
jgi:hypothetical protein